MGARILFLQHPGQNTRDIFFDVIEGYREAGHQVFVLELGPLWKQTDGRASPEAKHHCLELFSDTILAVAQANRIDFCVTLWANGHFSLGPRGQISFFEQVGLPVLMHWLDAPQWAHEGKVIERPRSLFNGPCSRHLINNPATAREMEGVLGFTNIMTLSNAASPTSFRPHRDEKKEFDIVFGVGGDDSRPTGLMLEQLESDELDVAAIRAEAAATYRPALFEIVRPAWENPAAAERFVDLMIQARLACRHEPVLDQLSRIAHQEPDLAVGAAGLLGDARRYVCFSMTLRGLESWERAFTFVYLARHFRCATFGPKQPFRHWPGEWEHLGWVAYRDQAKAYSRGRFGLNVMRWQDDVGLNLKPFEVTLSGACLLQSYRVGIEAHFDESEIVVFDTPAQCRDRVAQLLADPQRLARRAVAGRARSLAQHCWKHRAGEITRVLIGRDRDETPPPPAPGPIHDTEGDHDNDRSHAAEESALIAGGQGR
ncbi:MAG: glycosyltransferase family 1 protein [bacterium]|nr:glycosyltransferase family 1 protein [bacterium]